MATKKRPSGAKRAASATKARASAKKASKAKAVTKAKARRGRSAPVDVIHEEDIGAPSGTSTLVIVESPAKAKTIGKYLGRGYRVRATVGHIMDLPQKKLGIDLEHGFTPDLVPIPGKEKTIAELKSAAKDSKEVLIATDPDREGEAIAQHVATQISPKRGASLIPIRRVLFHEITKDAVQRAIQNAGVIDSRKVEAQQVRRHADFRAAIDLFVERGMLRGDDPSDAERDRLADVLSFIASPEGYDQLVVGADWSQAEFEAWLIRAVKAVVLAA